MRSLENLHFLSVISMLLKLWWLNTSMAVIIISLFQPCSTVSRIIPSAVRKGISKGECRNNCISAVTSNVKYPAPTCWLLIYWTSPNLLKLSNCYKIWLRCRPISSCYYEWSRMIILLGCVNGWNMYILIFPRLLKTYLFLDGNWSHYSPKIVAMTDTLSSRATSKLATLFHI